MTSARLSGSNASPSAHVKLLDDRRFRALLSDEDWGRLPLATWRRFSKRVADGDSVVYVAVVDEISFSDIGWWFAQAARLIGGPLPTGRDTGVPMIVTVTEDGGTGGQTWTRICARKRGFSASDPFRQAFRRSDRARRVCRLRRLDGAPHRGRGTGADLP
ncbi:hypothetical protein ACVWZ3_004607 [Bradyrhizobium sp. i1.3.6]